MTTKTIKASLQNTAACIARFGPAQDGAVATWFAILLVPMLGFTYGAIKFANLTEQRSSMTDAMDASALAIARQYEVLDIDPCDVATAGPGREAGDDDEARQKIMRFGREFFAENYAEYGMLYRDGELEERLDLARDLTFDLSCDDVTVNVTAYTDMGGVLASQFGLKSVALNLESNVTLFQQSKMEIALVLDVTGSMCLPGLPGDYDFPADCVAAPNRRIDEMKDAVQGMLDHDKVFGDEDESERVKFSIVPFNTFVNVGASYANTVDGKSDNVANWMDGWSGGEPSAHYHGINFLHAYEDGPVTQDYPMDGLGVPYSNVDEKSSAKVRVSDRRVNHFDLFRSVGDDDDPDASWKGCVEARPFPLDEIAHPAGRALSDLEMTRAFTRPSSAQSTDATTNAAINAAWDSLGNQPTGYDPKTVANSRFVPAFYADAPDCKTSRVLRDDSGNLRNDYDGDCLSFQSREDDLKDGDKHQDHGGHFWGEAWTVRDGYRAFFEWGPIPRRLHTYGVPNAANDRFIADETFLSRKPGLAQAKDKQRYRNLLLDMYQHGLNHTDPARRWPTGTESRGDLYGSLAMCQAPNVPYVYDAEIAAAMERFSYDHCSNEVNLRRAYVGIYRPNQRLYYGRYENLERSDWTGPVAASSYTTPTNGPNNGCPGPVLPLTNKKSEIEDVLDALEPAGGTNSAVGMAWGWRTLTHEAPYIEAVDPDSNEGKHWFKIAILLSDGENIGNNANYGTYTGFGYGIENRVRGDGTYNGYRRAIDDKTVRMCHRMRSRGIRVYTIGFAINAGSSADRMLRACAVNADSYFLASNASELNSAFDEIADQITELHVSG